MMDLITSRNNPKIKQARALRHRKERSATGLFLVEGIRQVAAAVEAEAAVEYVCYAPDLLTSPFARELIERESTLGRPCYATSGEVFASISEKDNPAGIIAVVRQARLSLDSLAQDSFTWGAALVAPQDPGNVGAILRTLDAVGADGLCLLDNAVDVHHPSAVRASMGALFSLPVVTASFKEFAEWVKMRGYSVLGTSAHAATDYRAAAYRRPVILLMGSEKEGLTADQMKVCDLLVRLPMHGRVTSLNLAVAAGVMLYAMREALQDAAHSPRRL